MRVVLDTNILISAVLFGGKPRIIHELVLNQIHIGFTSVVLLAEFSDVLRKKFRYTKKEIDTIIRQLEEYHTVVLPSESIDIIEDFSDNRVLEAAVEGECEVIITGDADLLRLKKYRSIFILTPDEFLKKYTQEGK